MSSAPAPDPVNLYLHAVEQARQTLLRIQPAQRQLPTPCTEWDVATVAEHMLSAHTGWATRIAAGPPQAGRDQLSRLTFARDAVLKVLAAPGGLDQSVKSWTGAPLRAGDALDFALLDLVIHTWDLATATGRDARMPMALVEYLMPFAAKRSEQGPNPYFKPRLALDSAASRQGMLLELTGRRG